MPVGQMRKNMSENAGFIAALDQSGGSTPGALRHYGIPDSAYSTDAQMFALMHEMRVRVITAPAFTGKKILAAILFEQTMNGLVKDTPVPTYLWREKGVVPFLKVDKGLEPEAVMIKVSIPEKADLYLDLIKHPRVQRVVALSGGYPRDEACERLAKNHGMIASFSRALLEDLRYTMTDAEFDAALAKSIDQIYAASTHKD